MASNSTAAAAQPRRRRAFPAGVIQRILGAAAAAALGIDAYVHFHDAGFYTAVTTPVISQATLFRGQAALAAAVGLALLIRPSRLWWAAALVVAASAFGAVMLYRYVDVGALGPIPNMYEPTWVSPGKLASAWAEGAATILTATGLALAISARPARPLTRVNRVAAAPGRRGAAGLDRVYPSAPVAGGLPPDPHERAAVPGRRGGRVRPRLGIAGVATAARRRLRRSPAATPPPRSAPCSSASAWACSASGSPSRRHTSPNP